MNKYKSTFHLDEFTQVFVVRYRDPLNKKRFAVKAIDMKKFKKREDIALI